MIEPVFGAGAAGLIVVVVELCKVLGLPARWSPVAAVLAGLAAGVAGQVILQYPGAAGWVEAVIGGVLTGAAAVGMYASGRVVARAVGGSDDGGAR